MWPIKKVCSNPIRHVRSATKLSHYVKVNIVGTQCNGPHVAPYRFQPQIDRVQNRETFFGLSYRKISLNNQVENSFFRISNISAPCPHAQLIGRTVIKKLWTFLGPWGPVTAMLNFSGKANTPIHSLGEDDTAGPHAQQWGPPQCKYYGYVKYSDPASSRAGSIKPDIHIEVWLNSTR